jgi:hypothetical protein
MPKHAGWVGRKFKIGDVVIAEFWVNKHPRFWSVNVRQYERTLSGKILNTKTLKRKFRTKNEASEWVQSVKRQISAQFRMWRRRYG